MLLSSDPIIIIYLIPAILISLSFHELAHAFISYRLGDPTAKDAGRLTLNPLKHLDPLGTLMILVTRFGWAKPVPINPMYYNDRRKGTILVSIAGPLSNILLAIIFAFPLLYVNLKYGYQPLKTISIPAITYNLSSLLFVINLNLAVFNVLPVPPLDGSKILSGVLPTRHYFKLMQYENYIGVIFLLIVFIFPGVLHSVMGPIVGAIAQLIYNIVLPIVSQII